MILPPGDAKDFLRTITALDVYFDSRLRMLKDTSLKEIRRLRAAGFADPAHISAYLEENPDHIPAAKLEEVRAWGEHGIACRFVVLEERKDGCLFMHTETPPAVYLVLGLTQLLSA